MTRPPNRPPPKEAPPAPRGLQDEIDALRKLLATRRERLEEWRRCRTHLTPTQADRLNRLIAEDEQTLRDLEAKRHAAATGAKAPKRKPGKRGEEPSKPHG